MPTTFFLQNLFAPRLTDEFSIVEIGLECSQSAFTWSKLTIETLEQGVKLCSKLTIKTPERHQWHISHFHVLVFLLLVLSM